MAEDEEPSSEERAQVALFSAIAGLAPHANPSELLTLAQVYDTVVGKDEPEAEKGYISTESATMLESNFWDEGGDRSGGLRGPIGFTPRKER